MRKKTAFTRNILSHTLLYNSRTALKILNAINSHPHLLINQCSLFKLSGTLAQCHGATVTLQDRMDRYRSIPALPARTSQSHRMVWVGRDLKAHPAPAVSWLLPSRSGSPGPHPAQPWHLQGWLVRNSYRKVTCLCNFNSNRKV